MSKRGLLYPLLLILGSLVINGLSPLSAQVKAGFSSDIKTGCAPLVVRFKDESTGNPDFWKWDLGNGTVSYFQNPAGTYFFPGTYTVKLIVRNGSQADSIVKVQHVTVYALPVPNFTVSDTAGCFPIKLKFTDFSTPGDGSIVKWLWDFGDGSTDTTQHTEHIYTAPGNYNVSLQVTNSRGCIYTLTKIRHVRLTDGVKAGFNFNAPPNCRPPSPVSFTNISTGTGLLSYEWDFGDGGSSTQPNPVHVYNTPGSFTVRLIVRNNSGCVDTLTRTDAITIGTVIADFDVTDTACAGSGIQFTNNSKPVPVGTTWTFGDATGSNITHPFKSFSNPGTYQVKLVSDFGTCKDSITKSILVLAQPTVSFTGTNTRACKPPLTTSFNSNAAGAVWYQWSFGDGGTGSGAQPTHTYSTAGSFDVTLVVTNAAGCSNTLVQPGLVQIRTPQVSLLDVPAEGCVPFLYKPVVSALSVDTIVAWTWDFGDGNTGTGPLPTHTYTTAGTYTVKITYTTAGGCTDSLTVVNAVRVGKKLQPGLSATPRDACAFQGIRFSDLTLGGIPDSWYWDFGDGGTSIDQHPTHLYQDTGYFSIMLVVTSNGCRDTLRVPNYIHIKPPIARFIDSSGCNNRFTRKFLDRSIGATSWYWEFGDGTTSTDRSPTHTYAAPGTYTVQLIVKNDTCEHLTMRQIKIIAEVPDFEASDTVICKGSDVHFKTKNVNIDNIASYTWSFGDGVTQTTGNETTHQYRTTGQFTVRLVIRDINGCSDTLTRSLYIRVTGPTADFSSIVPGACLNEDVVFIDSSATDAASQIKTWVWHYGDGGIDTLTSPPFAHRYAQPGRYTVKLITTDNNGCVDSISKGNFLLISKPLANFTSTDTATCVSKPVRFSNLSSGPSLTYRWEFGDTQQSTVINPVHSYSAEGIYTVGLFIRDQYGCEDSLIRPTYINVRNPVAQFSMSDSVSSCPPLVVNFENQSQHFISHEWDFGDGTRSSLQNPLHFYTYPGTYRAKLTVVSKGGCVDSFIRTIIVRGPQGTFTYDRDGGCVPTTVKFVADTKDKVTFIWDFNDGETTATSDSVITHTYTQMGEYLPKMILKDPQGCQVPILGLDTIRVFGVKARMVMSQQVVCDSGRVFFRDSSVANEPITGYHWSFGDGATSTQQHPSHVYNQNGHYPVRLVVTTAHNCRDTIQNISPLKVVQSPEAGIQGDTAACVPAILNFSGHLVNQDTAALNWKWDFGNASVSTLQDPPSTTYRTAGKYDVRLVLTNSSGCVDTAYYPVWARPLPLIKANDDLTICAFQSAPLLVSGGVQYTWLPAAKLSCTDCPAPVASPDSTGRYTVQGKNIYGCLAEDTVLIQVQQPFSIRTALGDTLCVGDSYPLFASGAELYNWWPSTGLDNVNSAQPRAKPDTSTLYRVIGRDNYNCFSDTAYVPVIVYPYPLVDAGKDQTISVGSSFTLASTLSSDVNKIRWSPEKWLDCANCPSPVASPRQTTRYMMEVSNDGGCVSRDDVTITVVCLEANLFMPNTFSPNGDGTNDVFYPRGKGIHGVKMFRVFNRWGEVVFEKGNIQANDISKGWNGSFKGKLASQDVYVYTIDVVCENNQVFSFKGNVALIR